MAWLRSYFFQRKEYIENKTDIKYLPEIDSGVPQGSLIEKLLFLIYVNDIYIFAEDTDLFILDENIDKLFQQMYKELKSVSTWFKAKRSTINTKWAIFHPTFKACFVPKKFTH